MGTGKKFSWGSGCAKVTESREWVISMSNSYPFFGIGCTERVVAATRAQDHQDDERRGAEDRLHQHLCVLGLDKRSRRHLGGRVPVPVAHAGALLLRGRRLLDCYLDVRWVYLCRSITVRNPCKWKALLILNSRRGAFGVCLPRYRLIEARFM